MHPQNLDTAQPYMIRLNSPDWILRKPVRGSSQGGFEPPEESQKAIRIRNARFQGLHSQVALWLEIRLPEALAQIPPAALKNLGLSCG